MPRSDGSRVDSRREPLRPHAFLGIEDTLTSRVRRAWFQDGRPVAREIGEAMDRGEWGEARDLVERFDVTGALEQTSGVFITAGLASALFGSRRARNNRTRTLLESEGGVPEVVSAAARIAIGGVAESINVDFRRFAREKITEAEREARDDVPPRGADVVELAEGPCCGPPSVVRKQLRRPFTRDFVSFHDRSTNAKIRMASSLHANRLASWGFMLEANLLGLKFYEIDAVLDSRTSRICRTLDGRVFPVAGQQQRIEQILTLGTEGLKAIAPFPRQDRYNLQRIANMTTDEIIANGWQTPPYHPNCRTLVRRTDRIPDDYRGVGAMGPPGRPPFVEPDAPSAPPPRPLGDEAPAPAVTAPVSGAPVAVDPTENAVPDVRPRTRPTRPQTEDLFADVLTIPGVLAVIDRPAAGEVAPRATTQGAINEELE